MISKIGLESTTWPTLNGIHLIQTSPWSTTSVRRHVLKSVYGKKKKIIASSVWQAESHSDITWPLLYHHSNAPRQPSMIRAHSEARRGFPFRARCTHTTWLYSNPPSHQITVTRLSYSGFQGMEVSPVHPPPMAFSTS